MLLHTVATFLLLLAARWQVALSTSVSVRPNPTTSQSGDDDARNGSSVRDSHASTRTLHARWRELPTSWPDPDHWPPEIAQIATYPRSILDWDRCQMIWHPKARANLGGNKKTIHEWVNSWIRQIERKKGKASWGFPFNVKNQAAPRMSAYVGHDRTPDSYYLFQLANNLPPKEKFPSKPISNHKALAILYFFRDKMQDSNWGIQPFSVELWENLPRTGGVQWAVFRATFKLELAREHSAPAEDPSLAVSAEAMYLPRYNCDREDNPTSAVNASMCASHNSKRALRNIGIGQISAIQSSSGNGQMPEGWPVRSPFDRIDPYSDYLPPTNPGEVPEYPRAQLRFQPTDARPLPADAVRGMNVALAFEIDRLQRLKANTIRWNFRDRRMPFPPFRHLCSTSNSKSVWINLRSSAPFTSSSLPSTYVRINNMEALAILLWVREHVKPSVWGPHEAYFEVWENFDAESQKDRIFKAVYRLGEEPHYGPRPPPVTPPRPRPPIEPVSPDDYKSGDLGHLLLGSANVTNLTTTAQ